jgi:hypothetical protein
MSEHTRDWIFLFGRVHVHPDTGESLAKRYVKIHGTEHDARKRMFRMFGDQWSHSSDQPAWMFEQAYGDTELPEAEWPKERET